jgi:hypothetical protein
VEWPVGEPLVAVCDLGANHVPPHPKCSCGVYALDTFETLKVNGYNWADHDEAEHWLIAEVNLWGGLRKGQVGYRTHKAYPKTVYVPAYLWAIGNAVRQRYVPMRFIDRFSGRRT